MRVVFESCDVPPQYYCPKTRLPYLQGAAGRTETKPNGFAADVTTIPNRLDRVYLCPYSLYLPCGSRGPGRAGRDGIRAQAVVGIGIGDSLVSNPVSVLVDPT